MPVFSVGRCRLEVTSFIGECCFQRKPQGNEFVAKVCMRRDALNTLLGYLKEDMEGHEE